jgi:hypothetical protein
MNQNENSVVVITPLDPDNTAQNKIFVTINGQDWQRNLSEIGLSFDSSESEIMRSIVPMIEEEFNQNIENLYKIRKATNNQNIYVIPNSTAGI